MSRRRNSLRKAAALLVMTLLATVLAGCVSLPESGTVQAGPAEDKTDQNAPFDFNPGGPEPDGTPVDIVSGFLLAMQATPLRTAVARQFLTAASSSSWVPEKATIVYDAQTLTTAGSSVSMRLSDIDQLDARGEWLGDTSHGRGLTYRLQVVREKGEWRISSPPDALIIPRPHFEARFQQYFVYFFDKSAQVLVPEPVYLPGGEQAPTLLVAGLLRGPDQDLLGAERTFFPAGTQLDDLSVPVSRDGTAQVPLSDEVLDLGDDDLNLALAQLSWTLRQVSGIERIRVTVDGSPLDLAGDGPDASVDSWSEYDPSVTWASQELFGIRDGRVVNLVGDRESRVSGLFGSTSHGLRTIAVDLPAERVAGVTDDGTRVLVAPRSNETGATPSPTLAKAVYAHGTDVLRPSWDIYGQLWVLDRTRVGAVLSVVRGGEATTLDAPGISGEDVRAFVLSRDGTRLVAVLHEGSRDRLVVARVLRDEVGKARRVAPADALPVAGFKVKEIRGLAWRSPGRVALLAGPAPGLSQVILVPVDGSTDLGDPATNAEVFRDEAVRIVTSPTPGAPLYVGTTTGQLYELAVNGRWTGTSIKPGLVSPTFVG